jgi:anti-sigma B factor antagonist
MSSAGLRILLASHKAMSAKRGMKVINVNDIIAEIFEITGFSDILDIE